MSSEINKTIGIRLAALRHARGMEAQQLADAVPGLTRTRLTRIENNRSEATAAELVRLAAALGVTSSVLTGEGKFSEFMDRVEAAQAGAGAR